jgi:nitrate reductase molybdenum cofactor assembly chaperone NarJ/NarW
MRAHHREADSSRVIRQAAAVCLAYPEPDVLATAGLLRAALAEKSSRQVVDFEPLLAFWKSSDPSTMQTHYVDVFDLSRKHSLYLSYWTDGDTRRRGEVLAAFKQRYRCSGFLVDTRGELPDYLPMVLEYAAIVDPADGTALLQEYRSSVELLRLALAERGTPYAGVLTAVCSTLPGASPADRKAVMAMAAAGPPTETVGLEPKDPRLLPIGDSR